MQLLPPSSVASAVAPLSNTAFSVSTLKNTTAGTFTKMINDRFHLSKINNLTIV
jgi:hypothetical protein